MTTRITEFGQDGKKGGQNAIKYSTALTALYR